MSYRLIPENADRRLWDKIDKDGPIQPHMNTPCWVWTGATSDFGHGVVRRGGQLIRVHRLLWEKANGPVPIGLCVLHECDFPRCCNTSHLFLGTKADNTADMMRKKRGKFVPHVGEANSLSKLTRIQVEEIRKMYGPLPGRGRPALCSLVDLAKRFGVSAGTIGFIVRGETWK